MKCLHVSRNIMRWATWKDKEYWKNWYSLETGTDVSDSSLHFLSASSNVPVIQRKMYENTLFHPQSTILTKAVDWWVSLGCTKLIQIENLLILKSFVLLELIGRWDIHLSQTIHENKHCLLHVISEQGNTTLLGITWSGRALKHLTTHLAFLQVVWGSW